MPTITRQQLLDLLDARLDRTELRELAYDVGLDLDNLEGNTKREDLLSLLMYHDKRQSLDALVASIAQRRPDLGLANTTIEPTIAPPPSPTSGAAPAAPTPAAFFGPASPPPGPSISSASNAAPQASPRWAAWTSDPRLRLLGYAAVVVLVALAVLLLVTSVSSDPTYDATTRVVGLVMTAVPAWLAFKVWQALRR